MKANDQVVFLMDVDNTLLDNDQVEADLKTHLAERLGAGQHQRYWEFFEELRAELGYADYLGALQRYRAAYPRDTHVLTLSLYLLSYPFAQRLYPGVLDVIGRLGSGGQWSSCRMGTWCFSPIRSSGRGCGKRSRAASSSISIKSRCSAMTRLATRLNTMSWLTISCASCRRSSSNGASASLRCFHDRDIMPTTR